MAGIQPVNFFSAMDPNAAQQQAALTQQQALAQKMMEEGAQQPDPTRTAPGGWVVPYGAGEGFTHAGKQIAAALMQKNINQQQTDLSMRQMQMLASMLRGGAPGAQNPMSPQSGTPSVMAGSGSEVPQPQSQQPMAGGGDLSNVLRIAAASQLGGPGAGTYIADLMKPTDLQKNLEGAGFAPGSPQANAAYRHTLSPQMNVRPGGTVFDTMTNTPVYIAPNLPPGSAPINPQQPQAGVLPIPGVGSVLQANKESEQRGAQPFGMQTMKVPVYLPGGDQTEVNLNPMQAEQYNRTGQLPPEIAASIPGYQQPGQSGMPPTNPQMPVIPGTTMSNPPMSVVPLEDREAFNAAIPKGAMAQPQGRPVVGRGQTQTEQIRQSGQTASNTEAGKEFISEMRQNYAKLRDVPATLENMERAKQLAATSAQQFMGPLGESKLMITKFLRSNLPGMGNLNTEGVTNAEELQSTLFNQVMDNLKKMDASPSQYQQQVMQEAFGTLRSDPQSVPKILNVFQDILRNRVAIHNDTVKSAEGRGTTFPYDINIKLPEQNNLAPNVPKGNVPQGFPVLGGGQSSKVVDFGSLGRGR